MFKKTSLIALIAIGGFVAQTALAADKAQVQYQVSLKPLTGPAVTEAAASDLRFDATLTTALGEAANLASTTEMPYVSQCVQTAQELSQGSNDETEGGESCNEEVPMAAVATNCITATLQTGYRLTVTPLSVDKHGTVRTAITLNASQLQNHLRVSASGLGIDVPQTNTVSLTPAVFVIPKNGNASYDFVLGATSYRLVLTAKPMAI